MEKLLLDYSILHAELVSPLPISDTFIASVRQLNSAASLQVPSRVSLQLFTLLIGHAGQMVDAARHSSCLRSAAVRFAVHDGIARHRRVANRQTYASCCCPSVFVFVLTVGLLIAQPRRYRTTPFRSICRAKARS